MATGETKHATSNDGTRIGYEVVGSGPPLILVHGSGADRSQWAPVAAALAQRHTVHLVDRRGRGASDDAAPDAYAVEREAEDLAAVVDAIEGRASVFGHGYGGLCALEAAAAGVDFETICIDDAPAGRPGPPMLPDELVDAMGAQVEAGRAEPALELFLRTIVGLNDEQIEFNRASPMWQARVATVHTIVREARAAASYQRDPERLARISAPVRFIVGNDSPPPFRMGAEAANRDVPGSELTILDRRLFTTMYGGDAASVAQQLDDWFAARP